MNRRSRWKKDQWKYKQPIIASPDGWFVNEMKLGLVTGNFGCKNTNTGKSESLLLVRVQPSHHHRHHHPPARPPDLATLWQRLKFILLFQSLPAVPILQRTSAATTSDVTSMFQPGRGSQGTRCVCVVGAVGVSYTSGERPNWQTGAKMQSGKVTPLHKEMPGKRSQVNDVFKCLTHCRSY